MEKLNKLFGQSASLPSFHYLFFTIGFLDFLLKFPLSDTRTPLQILSLVSKDSLNKLLKDNIDQVITEVLTEQNIHLPFYDKIQQLGGIHRRTSFAWVKKNPHLE